MNEFPGGGSYVCLVHHRTLRAGTVPPGMHKSSRSCLLINERRLSDPEEYRTDRAPDWHLGQFGLSLEVSGRICSLTAGAQMGYKGWEEQGAPNIWGRQHHWRGRQLGGCPDVNEQSGNGGARL